MKHLFILIALAVALQQCTTAGDRAGEGLPYLAKATEKGLITTIGDSIPFPEDSAVTIFFLVRHAEKAEGGKDPGLTDDGRWRAHRLATIVGDCGLDIGFTTPYRRTMGTLQPLNMRYKVPVAGYEPDKQEQLLDTIFVKDQGAKVFIVGHSNTIPQLLNALSGSDKYETLPEEVYDRLFVVFARRKGEAEVHEFRY